MALFISKQSFQETLGIVASWRLKDCAVFQLVQKRLYWQKEYRFHDIDER
jgi:hypothetical protein